MNGISEQQLIKYKKYKINIKDIYRLKRIKQIDNIKKVVAIYCRVSHEEQKKYGLSVIDQITSLTKYAKEKGFLIYDYYIDEGISASTMKKRKEYLRLLQDLDPVDIILFTKLDRFSRNVRDANNTLEELTKHKTAFLAIDEDDIDTSTADGKFIFNLKVNLAEHERNKDSERIKRINRYKYDVAKTVVCGSVPFGYKIGEDKKIYIDEEKSKMVVALFDKYIDTQCLSTTLKWFHQTYNNNKSMCSIKRYLHNKAYIGQYQHKILNTKKYETILNYCPQIIDTEKFKKVQLILKNNKKSTPNFLEHKAHDYIFSGLLKCQNGHTLTGRFARCKYYNCNKKHIDHNCNQEHYINEKKFEKHLINNIEEIINKRITEYQINQLKSKKKYSDYEELKKKQNTLTNKIEKLTNLYLDDKVNIEYYNKMYSNLNKELKEINKKIDLSETTDTRDFTALKKFIDSSWKEIYNTLNENNKNLLWRTIIKKIIIRNYNDYDIYFIDSTEQ